MKLSEVRENLLREVNRECEAMQTPCGFNFEQALTVENGEFSCDPRNRPLYRATVIGAPTRSCNEFDSILTSWIESGSGSVVVQGNRFSIADFCDVEINSPTDDINCNEPTTPSRTTDDSPISVTEAQSGASLTSQQLVGIAGGLAGLVVLVVVIASVLFVVTVLASGWKSKKKK